MYVNVTSTEREQNHSSNEESNDVTINIPTRSRPASSITPEETENSRPPSYHSDEGFFSADQSRVDVFREPDSSIPLETRRQTSETLRQASVLSLPVIEPPRRLSLQLNSSGNPVIERNRFDPNNELLIFNPNWRNFPADRLRMNKLPGGSRYFVSPVDDSTRRTSTASSVSTGVSDLSSGRNIQTSFSYREETLSAREPPLVSRPASTRPISSRNPFTNSRPRPLSTIEGQMRRTGLNRNLTRKSSLVFPLLSQANVFHLPPGGQDCHPGCGYSGLPCYVCSTKGMADPTQTERRQRSSIFSVLHRRDLIPTHQSRAQQTTTLEMNEELSCSESVFKPCCFRCASCLKFVRDRIYFPQSRMKQIGLSCFVIYLLFLIHIGINKILHDYKF